MDKGYKDFNKKDLIIDLKVQMNRIENMLVRILNELQPKKVSGPNINAFWGTNTPYKTEPDPFAARKNGPKGEGCCGGTCGN